MRIALVSVVPQTGEVVWDEFDGTWARRHPVSWSDEQIRQSGLSWRRGFRTFNPQSFYCLRRGSARQRKRSCRTSLEVHSEYQPQACAESRMSANTVRVERVEAADSYAAFDSLTKFYKRKGGRPQISQVESGEIDLTGDDEEEDEAQDESNGGTERFDLASGLPGG